MADTRRPDMSAVNILKVTQQCTGLVWCKCRWECILAQPGECNCIVHVQRRCGLSSNYFDHLFILPSVFPSIFNIWLHVVLVVMHSFVVLYRTEDFLDHMAINPQTQTAVDYTVCAICLKCAGLRLCN